MKHRGGLLTSRENEDAPILLCMSLVSEEATEGRKAVSPRPTFKQRLFLHTHRRPGKPENARARPVSPGLRPARAHGKLFLLSVDLGGSGEFLLCPQPVRNVGLS